MSKRILRGVLFGAFPVVLLWVLLAATGRADDFICGDCVNGCTATMPCPAAIHGPPPKGKRHVCQTKVHKFTCGQWVSTGSGWVGMDMPGSGWIHEDDYALVENENAAVAGLLPLGW